MDVVALGELLIDFTWLSADGENYPALQAHPGGAPANYLAALSAFGAETAMIGKVGEDAFGRLLTESLERAGICTEGIVRDEDFFTTLAFVTLDDKGEREFSFARKPGADTRLDSSELKLGLIDSCRVFHFGSLSLTDEPSRSACLKALGYARDRGKLISYDPNLRMSLWKSPGQAAREIRAGLELADVVKISDEELDFLFGMGPEEGAGHIINNFGAKLVLASCGERGCFIKNKKAEIYLPALKVKAVDTTGAGDIFGGSAMWGLLSKGKDPEELNREELREIGSYAVCAASLSVTRPGGMSSVPEKAEVLRALEAYSAEA